MENVFMRVKVLHLHDLAEKDIGGIYCYTATGSDPQMILGIPDTNEPLKLKIGDYRFYFLATKMKGGIRNPRLYIDFGEGFSELPETNVFLKAGGVDIWYGDIRAKKEILAIRFDPSETTVEFNLHRLVIHKFEMETYSLSKLFYESCQLAFSRFPSSIKNLEFFSKQIDKFLSRFFQLHLNDKIQRDVCKASEIGVFETSKDEKQFNFKEEDHYQKQYIENFGVACGARDASYAPLASRAVRVCPADPAILAFYLPQFHPIPENDEWWGRGFTEWTNVSKALPQFKGHYQPRLPGELGFYDLRLEKIMERQIELAKMYGLTGFCFYYYSFNGKRVLERPLENFLAAKEAEYDFPFCLCWANENWTKRWDGAEQHILLEQKHSEADHKSVFLDLIRHFKDPRYIRIDGKPMILIYRPLLIHDLTEMIDVWRSESQKAGLQGIYVVGTTAFGFNHPDKWGLDALCQIPPHGAFTGEINEELVMLNPEYAGSVYDYADTIEGYLEGLGEAERNRGSFDYFPGVMMGWDNEARKPGKGNVFNRATPSLFHKWLAHVLDWTKRNNAPGRQFVFVNAWNEWAEGTYLEPDRRYGYAYLNAVSATRGGTYNDHECLQKISENLKKTKTQGSKFAIFIHLFYQDLVDEFVEAVSLARELEDLDVVVSIPDSWSEDEVLSMIQRLDPVRLIVTENRGRDIWPFLQSVRVAADIRYEYICKIHSKKSTHLSEGEKWRRSLIQGLIGQNALTHVKLLISEDKKIGLLAPEESFHSCNDPSALRDNLVNVRMLLERLGRRDLLLNDFVAGSMMWLNFEAIKLLASESIEKTDFDVELGAIDGSIAHAFERIIPTLINAYGYKIQRYSL